MLRRKMLVNLGPLIVLLLLTAVGVIWQLEEVLKDVRHIQEQAGSAVADIDELSIAVNQSEIDLYQVEGGREKHLDRLIASLERVEELIDRLGDHYLCQDPRGAPLYYAVANHLPEFRRQLSALATVQDPGLAQQHSEAALATSLALRQSTLPLGSYVRDHVRQEQQNLTSRFQRLVLVLSVVFLVVINLAVVMLIRMALMVLRPVDQLVEATKAIGQERFDARVAIVQKDEFGQLADAYNKMAEQLQASEQRRVEVLSQVALTMNHELNNAMSIIELQLQVLTRRTESSPAQESCLRQIRAGLERMTQTVAALKRVKRIVLTDYLPGTRMLDLARSTESDENDSASFGARRDRTSTSTSPPDT